MNRANRKYWVAAIFIAAGVIFALDYFVHLSPSPVPSRIAKASKEVAVAKAGRKDLSRQIEFTAELVPYQEVDLYGKVAGYLRSINVDIGDKVKAGQVIATLDLAPQEADLARAKAVLEKARLNYDELRLIAEKKPGLIAVEDIENARMDYEKAEADLSYARVIVSYGNIVIPFDGVITKRYVHPGALIQSGVSSSTQAMPVVHLAETSKLRMDFPVQESLVPKIKPGIPVIVHVNATGKTLRTVIARIDDKLDDSTRTMIAEVDIDNRSQELTSGMYATATVDLDRRQAALSVPLLALSGADKSSVWVVNNENRLEKRHVTLGLQTPDDVEILQGVKVGEQVVLEKFDTLTVGETVHPELRQRSIQMVQEP